MPEVGKYKFAKKQGCNYQSTYPAGTMKKTKLKKNAEMEFWGLTPEEYRAMQNAQQKKAKVIGFVNFANIPINPIDTFIFELNGVQTGFPMTAKPKNEIELYLCVGNNNYVGLETVKIKDNIKAIKEVASIKKSKKKRDKEAKKKAKRNAR